MATSTLSQTVDSQRWKRISELAARLDVPRSRVLDELLRADPELLVAAVRKPAEASKRLATIETLQQGQEVGEAVIRYLETRKLLLNPERK